MATPNTNTELFLANTTSNSGTINLPAASSIPGRVINFKDSNTTFGINALTLVCNGSDTFEDGTTTKILKEKGGIIQIVASGTKWFILTGTQLNSANVSTFVANSISTIITSTASLQTSSINFSQVSSIYSQSTLALFNSNVFAGTRVWPKQNVNKYISTQVFLPNTIRNAVSTLSFWFDASVSTSMIVSTNSTILIWNTVSTLNTVIVPNLYVLTFPIGVISNAASYVPNILNGYGGVSCGTTNFQSYNYATLQLSFFTNSLNSEFTTITLCTRTGTGNSGKGIQSQILTGNYRVALNGGSYTMTAPGAFVNTNTIDVLCNVPTIIVGTRQGGNLNVRFNGNNTSLSNYSDNILTYGIAYNLYIGNDGFGGYCPLIMYEFFHYRVALQILDIQRLEGYLAWKWGLQSNLINTHPFRYVPPY